LIVNGVFDSISAGILIYTGLVELVAHEFMFSSTMRKAKAKLLLSAFVLMCLGAGLMALHGKVGLREFPLQHIRHMHLRSSAFEQGGVEYLRFLRSRMRLRRVQFCTVWTDPT
jgi:ZIP Zinc transporter